LRRHAATLGIRIHIGFNPIGVASRAAGFDVGWRRTILPDTTPSGLNDMGDAEPQGSEFLATLGSVTQSRWDSLDSSASHARRTDTMRPPRKSLFNSSFALPCPLAGIWINSNGIAHFSQKISGRGFAPTTPYGFIPFKIHHSKSKITSPAPLPSLHCCVRSRSLAIPFRSLRCLLY
jgi:hypothetical protein